MTVFPKRDPESKLIGSGYHQFRSNRLSADKVSTEEAIEEEMVVATGFEIAFCLFLDFGLVRYLAE